MKIPFELRDFAVWLNPSNLKVFNKLDLALLAGKMLRTQADSIPLQAKIMLSNGLTASDYDLGVFVLRVYFYQLMVEGRTICLDLRVKQFDYTNCWEFKGKKLSYRFSSSMSSGLMSLYQAFYEDAHPSLVEPLSQIGLIKRSWSGSQKKELEALFLQHFLKADGEKKQNFKFRHMLDSFSQIFTYIKNAGGRVPSEFGLLGVYLTSLYLTLDPLDLDFDVEACYFDAKKIAGRAVR